ncbi:MAG: acyl-CoA thioesterase [Desulfobacterales bacterium]|nr:acyl-CoA thioesterase [Deltaproteobacteria bacterium]NNK96354.1 acyl-CoA thioesterase [Desulfobacterales bacterium]
MKNKRVFTTSCRVLYGDTDAGGVVYYAHFLRYFEKARTELMRQWVCSYREIEAIGLIMPVTECFARYKASAFYDDLLTIETEVCNLRKYTCQFNYRIIRQDDTRIKPTLLVKGYTIHAAVNQVGKLTKLPEEIMEKLRSLTTPDNTTVPEQND